MSNFLPNTWSRRQWLETAGGGAGWLALQGMLGSQQAVADASLNPLAARPSHFPAKAKSMIGESIVNVERFNMTGSNNADNFLGGSWKDWFVGGGYRYSWQEYEVNSGDADNHTFFVTGGFRGLGWRP